MTERQSHFDELQRLATSDEDTGLLNYRGLRASAESLDGTDARVCLYLQLQGFFRTVAARGRPAGKQILLTITERIRHCAEAVDADVTLARVGEAAFALLVTGESLALARACQRAVNAPIPYAGMLLEGVRQYWYFQLVRIF